MYLFRLTKMAISILFIVSFIAIGFSAFYLMIVGGKFSDVLFTVEKLSFWGYTLSLWIFGISAIFIPFEVVGFYKEHEHMFESNYGPHRFLSDRRNSPFKYILPFVECGVDFLNGKWYDFIRNRDIFFYSMFLVAYFWVILKITEIIS